MFRKVFFTLLLAVLLVGSAYGQGLELIKGGYVDLTNKASKAAGGKIDTAWVYLNLNDVFFNDSISVVIYLYQDTTQSHTTDSLRSIVAEIAPAFGTSLYGFNKSTTIAATGPTNTSGLAVTGSYVSASATGTNSTLKAVVEARLAVPMSVQAVLRIRSTSADTAYGSVDYSGVNRIMYAVYGLKR